MGSHCTLVLYPIKMSQKLVNLLLRLFVLAFVLLAESGSGSFNITRYTAGDVFQNINSSRSCNESGAKCVFDGENSPFCGINCCFCRCNSLTPTYLQRNGSCSSEDRLMSVLKAKSTIQGKLILLPWLGKTWSLGSTHNFYDFGIERADVRYSSIFAKRRPTFRTCLVKGYINSFRTHGWTECSSVRE